MLDITSITGHADICRWVWVVSPKLSICKASSLGFVESAAGCLQQFEKQEEWWNNEFLFQTTVYQAPGSGRARRDAAARAMQGWHAQRLLGYGEVAESAVKVCWDPWISHPHSYCSFIVFIWMFLPCDHLYFLA